MAWSGLRGAVGLVLAIMVDMHPAVNEHIGSQFMFHIGGIAMLTLVINATLAGPLLRYLGFTDTPLIEEHTIEHLQQWTKKETNKTFEEIHKFHSDLFKNIDVAAVKQLVPTLSGVEEDQLHNPESSNESEDLLDQRKEQTYREIFMRAVEADYWAEIEDGMLPRTSRPARILLISTSDAQLHPNKELADWDFIASKINGFTCCPVLNNLVDMWPLRNFSALQNFFPSERTLNMWKVYTAVSYITAHESADKNLRQYFEGSIINDDVRASVANESKKQRGKAHEVLNELPEEVVTWCKQRMMAGKIIQLHVDKVAELEKLGVLDHKGAHHIVHHLLDDSRKLATMQVDHSRVKANFSKRSNSSDAFQRRC